MSGIGVTLCAPIYLGHEEAEYQVSRGFPSSLGLLSWNEFMMHWHNKLQVLGADMHLLSWGGCHRYLGQVHNLKKKIHHSKGTLRDLVSTFLGPWCFEWWIQWKVEEVLRADIWCWLCTSQHWPGVEPAPEDCWILTPSCWLMHCGFYFYACLKKQIQIVAFTCSLCFMWCRFTSGYHIGEVWGIILFHL